MPVIMQETVMVCWLLPVVGGGMRSRVERLSQNPKMGSNPGTNPCRSVPRSGEPMVFTIDKYGVECCMAFGSSVGSQAN